MGYTNAGKSTLLNRLGGADVLVADMLFATLDPTTRRVKLPSGREALFTDTVGFIQKLPTEIVAAFRATLEEIADADILLHVVDVTHSNAAAQMEAVADTLAELEVDHLPQVVALNKVDGLPAGADPVHEMALPVPAVAISALSGAGMEMLLLAVEAALERNMDPIAIFLPYQRGDLMSLMYERGQVVSEQHEAEGVRLMGRIPRRLVPYFAQFRVSHVE